MGDVVLVSVMLWFVFDSNFVSNLVFRLLCACTGSRFGLEFCGVGGLVCGLLFY